MEILTEYRIDHWYINLIENIYKNATASVTVDDRQTQKFPVKREVLLLTYTYKGANLSNNSININGGKVNHLKFTNDFVLITAQKR